MKKPTLQDIARKAEVGTATVERVLNGRGGVRPETAERVVLAARTLDWPGRLPERYRGITRVEIILVRPETSFFKRLSTAFRNIAATLDPAIHLQIVFVDEDDPRAIARRIAGLTERTAGLVLATPDHPEVRSTLQDLAVTDRPIVQIVTRTIPEAMYVGINNYAVGRMAGLMMARMGQVEGSVVALCHSPVYPVHRERIRGFSDYLCEHPGERFSFDLVAFGLDDQVMNAEQVGAILADRPAVAGIYNAGGGNAGVLQVLKESGRDTFFVGHELDHVTCEALKDGVADVVFDQLPEIQAQRAVDLVLAKLGLTKGQPDNPAIQFTTVTAENL